jgi:hypothetical protein
MLWSEKMRGKDGVRKLIMWQNNIKSEYKEMRGESWSQCLAASNSSWRVFTRSYKELEGFL